MLDGDASQLMQKSKEADNRSSLDDTGAIQVQLSSPGVENASNRLRPIDSDRIPAKLSGRNSRTVTLRFCLLAPPCSAK